MKLRFIARVLLLSVLMLLVGGCGDTQPLPDIGADIEVTQAEQTRDMVPTPISTPVETTPSIDPAKEGQEESHNPDETGNAEFNPEQVSHISDQHVGKKEGQEESHNPDETGKAEFNSEQVSHISDQPVGKKEGQEESHNPDETGNTEFNPEQVSHISDQHVGKKEKKKAFFWNERRPGFPDCTTEFKFNHQFANPEDVVKMSFGMGGHIEPHEHMLYWESEPAETIKSATGETRHFSRKIQLYAPTNIYRVNLGYANRTTKDGEEFVEWGGQLFTCNGHQLMLGHIGEPSDEMLAALAEAEPTCGLVSSYNPEPGCTWLLDTFIPSGTPIFKNSGYTGAFDFGLELFGLTDAELQEQPGYGYSITPWRVGSGRAVCPIEYFPEPLRTEYRKRLSDHMTGELFECGPFNQDVPGTAMGFWLPSPSPETPPLDPSEAYEDEWETMWLYQSNNDPSVHILKIGNNTFGLDYGDYQIATISEGLVNRRWDSIKPGHVYCSEFIGAQNEASELTIDKILIIGLSEDGLALTVEATNGYKCGDGPWSFQGTERTFYR